MCLKAIVADIQHASLHDGPGLRTTVFLKGCPLSCAWCHNPECISFKPEMMYYPEKCIGCGKCDVGCFSGAKVICGKEMTVDEVFDEIMQDKPYYGNDGGVTVSGGEPLSQPEFTLALLNKCRLNGIHTALETSLYSYNEEIFKSCDLIMADLKLWDDQKHILHTGVSNERIIENFKKLDRLNIPFIMRTPVIDGISDAGDIKKIADFARTLKNLIKYELLPYHPLGITKSKALRREQTRFGAPANMEELKKYADISGQVKRA